MRKRSAEMADDTSTETTDATEMAASGQNDAGTQQQAPDVPPEMKRALSKANKEAEGLRLKLKEFEDRDKTDLQKLEERATAAEGRLPSLEVENVKLSIALDKGLSLSQARRLVGSTKEELEADAEQLMKDLGRPSRAPGPNRAQGSSGNSSPADANSYMNALIRSQRT